MWSLGLLLALLWFTFEWGIASKEASEEAEHPFLNFLTPRKEWSHTERVPARRIPSCLWERRIGLHDFAKISTSILITSKRCHLTCLCREKWLFQNRKCHPVHGGSNLEPWSAWGNVGCFQEKVNLVFIDVTTEYMPLVKDSLTLVHKDGQNAFERKERALY